MTLDAQLATLRHRTGRGFTPEQQAILERHLVNLREEAIGKRPQPGSLAPSFALPDQHGVLVSSSQLLTRGMLVVHFTRGAWCPYCDAEVRAINVVYDAYRDAGADIVVISPQSQRRSARQAEDGQIRYHLLSDRANLVGKAYGVAYPVPGDLQSVFEAVGLDLPSINESAVWELPFPARFIIGQNGTILHAEANPDHRYRPDAEVGIDLVQWFSTMAPPA